MCRDSYICAEIALFVLNLSGIIFFTNGAPYTNGNTVRCLMTIRESISCIH